jgi:predicted ATP-dependent endonuclease of OLD family
MAHISVIKRFEVSELFGLHDYQLDFGTSSTGEPLHENLLYGDNGTGKTTILKIMYHLLSKKRSDGSRTYLSQIPFKRIYLELTAGQSIELTKDKEQDLTFFDGSSSTTIAINTDPDDGAVWASKNPDLPLYEKFLDDLKIEQLYLSDDRMIMTSYRRFEQRRPLDPDTLLLEDNPRNILPTLNAIDLDALATRVRDIIRDRLFESSVYGQSNVNNIYLDLAKRLVRQAPLGQPHPTQTLQDIEKRVKVIASDYNTASSLEIFPRVDFEEFVSVARESGDQRSNAVAVIETYLDTIEAQVTAVKGIAKLLNDLVEEINSYLVNKRLTFSIRSGFKVISSRKRLKFTDLSSGERQLLFLMLISFVTRDDKSIVYIDEPELSLNIKWQRRLISSILKLIAGTETQLIAATHSFEILATHRDAIIDLNRASENES